MLIGDGCMTYNKLLEILLSKNVYDEIKNNEIEIFKLIPELKVCKGFNQNNKWHIYDVYEHVLHVVNNVRDNKSLRLAALFHDIGKPIVYFEDMYGVGHFYNHWNTSIEIFNKYKKVLELSIEEYDLIKHLIFYHDINLDKINSNDLNQMMNFIKKDNINLLFELKRADLLAQSPNYHFLLSNIDIQEKKLIKNMKNEEI